VILLLNRHVEVDSCRIGMQPRMLGFDKNCSHARV
jgi:hypothetical protein